MKNKRKPAVRMAAGLAAILLCAENISFAAECGAASIEGDSNPQIVSADFGTEDRTVSEDTDDRETDEESAAYENGLENTYAGEEEENECGEEPAGSEEE